LEQRRQRSFAACMLEGVPLSLLANTEDRKGKVAEKEKQSSCVRIT
jgi:hypothetical protein